MKLCTELKTLKDNRIKYRIKPVFKFCVDNDNYMFSLLPTVIWQPWIYRYLNCYVIDIWWLHCHIGIGLWEDNKSDKT